MVTRKQMKWRKERKTRKRGMFSTRNEASGMKNGAGRERKER